LGENKSDIRSNTEALLGAGKEVGLDINVKEIKSMFCLVTRMQHSIII